MTMARRRPPWRNFSPASRPSLQNAMPRSCPAGNKGGSCTLRIAMNFCSRSFDGLEHKTVRDVKKDWTSGMAGIVWFKRVDKTSFPHHTAKTPGIEQGPIPRRSKLCTCAGMLLSWTIASRAETLTGLSHRDSSFASYSTAVPLYHPPCQEPLSAVALRNAPAGAVTKPLAGSR